MFLDPGFDIKEMVVAHFKTLAKISINKLKPQKVSERNINHYMKLGVICYIFSTLMKQNNHWRENCTYDSQFFHLWVLWKCFLEATASKRTQTVLVNEEYLNKNHVKITIQG